MSLSRLNPWLPGCETQPKMRQGTTACHPQSAAPRLAPKRRRSGRGDSACHGSAQVRAAAAAGGAPGWAGAVPASAPRPVASWGPERHPWGSGHARTPRACTKRRGQGRDRASRRPAACHGPGRPRGRTARGGGAGRGPGPRVDRMVLLLAALTVRLGRRFGGGHPPLRPGMGNRGADAVAGTVATGAGASRAGPEGWRPPPRRLRPAPAP